MIKSIIANFLTDGLKVATIPERRTKFFLFFASKAKIIGLEKIYQKSTQTSIEFEEHFKKSSIAKIMQIRGSELIDKKMKHLLKYRNNSQFDTKILLLNPNSIYVTSRAKKIEKSPLAFAADIKSNIRKLENFIKQKELNIDFCLYSQEPIFNIHLFDEVVYLSFYSDREAIKGKERQDVVSYKINKSSLLYESMLKYYDYIWNEQSSPIDELKDHYEIEKKYQVVNKNELIEKLKTYNPKKFDDAYYEDYYFTSLRGKHYERSEREYRIRVNLKNKKVFLSKKRIFNSKHKESKLEMETYIGYYGKMKYILDRIKNNGYKLYSRFRKHTENYEITVENDKEQFRDRNIIFIFTIARLEKVNYKITHQLFDKEFLEIETLVPAKTSQEQIEFLQKKIDSIAKYLGDCITPCPTKYSEITRFE